MAAMKNTMDPATTDAEPKLDFEEWNFSPDCRLNLRPDTPRINSQFGSIGWGGGAIYC
jgi:hypothetical protein